MATGAVEERILENQQIMLQALEKTKGLIAVACKMVGINRSTHYDWMNKYPAYKEAVEDISELTGDFVESKFLKNIQNGDTGSIIFYLKTKLRHRGYQEKTQNENVNVNLDAAISRQEAKELLSDLEKELKLLG